MEMYRRRSVPRCFRILAMFALTGPTPTLSRLSRGSDDEDDVEEPPSSSSSVWGPARAAALRLRRCSGPAPAAEAELAKACGQENTPPGPGSAAVGSWSGLAGMDPAGLVGVDDGGLCTGAVRPTLSSTLCSGLRLPNSWSVNEFVRCMASCASKVSPRRGRA